MEQDRREQGLERAVVWEAPVWEPADGVAWAVSALAPAATAYARAVENACLTAEAHLALRSNARAAAAL